MQTPWPLYNIVNQGAGNKFQVYRCIEPGAVVTKGPWFPTENVCPCDPKLSFPSGRGLSGCPFGVQDSSDSGAGSQVQASRRQFKVPSENEITGNIFNSGQFIPPQMDPRPLSRIGVQWRSAN
jgi:hypothetical protein